MKQTKFFKLFLTLLFSISIGTAFAQDRDVKINPKGGNTSQTGGGHNKIPVRIPNVYITEDNVLVFDASCINTTITIKQNDVVVFSAVVPTSGEVELPETFNGEYQLEFTLGAITFIGEFQL